MKALVFTTFGSTSVAYGPTGWVSGQYVHKGRPSWAEATGPAKVTITDWDGDETTLDALVKWVDLPQHPFHHVLAEHLRMAGWLAVFHTQRSKGKTVREAVSARLPGGTPTLFEVPPKGDVDVLVEGDRVGGFPQHPRSMTEWLKTGARR